MLLWSRSICSNYSGHPSPDWRFLSYLGLNATAPAVQAIELRTCLDQLSPAFLREHIQTPPGLNGAAMVESVLNDFCKLLQ